MTARAGILAVGLALLLAGGALAQDNPREIAAQARAVLKQHCHKCHSGQGSESGLDFDVLRPESMTVKGEEGKGPILVPGQPDDSPLYRSTAKRMPPKSEKVRPTEADRAALERWIKAGAPPFPQAETRVARDTKDLLILVRDHLRKAPLERRRFLRYFTLTHLYNNPKIPDEDLRVYRAAFSKALNSLSWTRGIVLPEPIDKEETVYVVDLTEIDWDQGNLFGELLRYYPYGLRYNNHPDPELQQIDHDINAMSHCEVPYIRADWFVATATRPPLYHSILRIPYTAQQLEYKLGVDVRLNFENNKLARSGFSKSGVSGQNRLVERHRARDGAYWKSYDFKEKNDKNDLRRLPLGPLDLFPVGKHPYPDQAFDADGGELIWNLPNGLQAYMLIDPKGLRIDAGPEDVVSDGTKTSGTSAIVNGLSCMFCHKHGMLPVKDFIRDGAAVFGTSQQKVQYLYPPQEEMNRLLREDEKRFLESLDRATGPFLKVGKDKDRPIRDFEEPIGIVARQYRLEGLDLTAAAFELGVKQPADLVRKVGESRLRELGVGPLMQPGGTINRGEWEAGRARSLMQRVAVELYATPQSRENP